MTPSQARLVDTLRDRFGPDIALTDAADIAPWLTDWRGRWTGSSDALVQPASTDQVAAIVRLAGENGVALGPQGGNTSMVGGATPPEDSSALILSLRRMNHIRAIDGHHAVAEAGVILSNLHDAAEKVGARFPLTLGSRGSATIGGLASTNPGGTQVHRFGTMRGLVAGVEAVLPDGSIHSGLSGLKKDNRGPSIDQLMIGAEGTLGVITAVRLRLVPPVAMRAVAWVGLESPADALALLRSIEARTEQVEGFELLPDESLQAVIAHIPGTRSPLFSRHPWHVLIEATAHAGQDDPQSLLEGLLSTPLVKDAAIASSEAQAEAFWRIRDSLSEAERLAFGPATQHDISVPIDALPAFLSDATARVETAFPGTRASGFGHLGDGNIHFHVRAGDRARADWVATEGLEVMRLVDDLVTEAGGSISAEHGIGQMKRDELARLAPDRVATLRAIKSALDPDNLMNPGKLV
jgi:FAD/FMN-containing dehydrogenase